MTIELGKATIAMTMIQRRVYAKIEQVSSQGPDKPFYNHAIPAPGQTAAYRKRVLAACNKRYFAGVPSSKLFLKGVPRKGRPHIDQSKKCRGGLGSLTCANDDESSGRTTFGNKTPHVS